MGRRLVAWSCLVPSGRRQASSTSIPVGRRLVAWSCLFPIGKYAEKRDLDVRWRMGPAPHATFAAALPTSIDNRRFSGPLSLRRSSHLRSTLFQMGYLTALHCPDCTRTFCLARQRGMSTFRPPSTWPTRSTASSLPCSAASNPIVLPCLHNRRLSGLCVMKRRRTPSASG